MPRSKVLPAELDPSARQLIEQLRRLKDHGELTMRQLAAKTGYSARSWERYLGGTTLPPAEAVEALARITGADPVPLFALHEVAAATWGSRRVGPAAPPRPTAPVRERQHQEGQQPERQQGQQQEQEQKQGQGQEQEQEQQHERVREGRGEQGAEREEKQGQPIQPIRPTEPQAAAPASSIEPTPSPAPAPAPAPGRFPHIALTAGVVALTVAVLAAVLLMLRLDEDGAPAAVVVSPRTTTASPPPTYTCRITRADGHWSAGINHGRNTEIFYGATGADVAEAQCLLRRAGISPGGIDGMFGPLTLRAVKAFQQRAGLVDDGMLGPRSWKALRG
ncbi:peptidoglycan-binding protein [Streptomyces sp. NPDC004528]|uniref:peptidoglycan-binding protein n=1 Tax=Streptomyces sp. NPDC004528 TaxID=3154550 RepID=UPI0033A7028F